MKPNVILIGGLYGAGKSTLCLAFRDLLGPRQASAIIFDDLTDARGQHLYDTTERWQVFLPRILEHIASGSPHVIAEASFHQRHTRDTFFQQLEPLAAVHGLFFMLPMRTIARRLQDRSEHRGRITSANYAQNLRRFNRAFPREDNTDLLLPSNRKHLSAEYLAQMQTLPQNRVLVENPALESSMPCRWLVITEHFDPQRYVELLKADVHDPLSIRARLEAHLPGQHAGK